MRLLTLLGVALVFCTGCHSSNRGGPMGFGLLGSNPGNGVTTAPPAYAAQPQYIPVQQPAPVAVTPAPQIVAAPAPQPIIVQAAPVAAPAQVVQQPVAVQPAAYYQNNACQPCQPVCQPAACCTPCQ